MKEIEEKNIYEYQSIADSVPVQVKVIQKIIHKNKQGEIIRVRIEVSRDLLNCINPFRIDASELT